MWKCLHFFPHNFWIEKKRETTAFKQSVYLALRNKISIIFHSIQKVLVASGIFEGYQVHIISLAPFCSMRENVLQRKFCKLTIHGVLVIIWSYRNANISYLQTFDQRNTTRYLCQKQGKKWVANDILVKNVRKLCMRSVCQWPVRWRQFVFPSCKSILYILKIVYSCLHDEALQRKTIFARYGTVSINLRA